MHLMIAYLFLLSLAVLCAAPVPTVRADQGVIEFSNLAPPPNEQEKALAAAWSRRVAALAQHLDSLANALRATAKLRQVAASTGTATSEQHTQIEAMTANWEKARQRLFTSSGGPVAPVDPESYRGKPPEPQPMWHFHPDQVAAHVTATLKLAGALAGLGPSGPSGEAFDRSAILATIDGVLADHADWFDEMVAEHGILNSALGYYPFFVEPQTAVSCGLINANSRNFKCVGVDATGLISDPSWLFGEANLDEFCVATEAQSYNKQQSKELAVRVRRTLVDQPPVYRPLAEARVNRPRSKGELRPKCG